MLFRGDNLKTMKGFILFIIALCTALAILYLVFQTRRLEKYTGVIDYSDKCYIIFSTDGGVLKDGRNINDVLSFTADYLKQSEMEAVVVNETKNDKTKNKIVDLMKKDRKYILLDINPTKLISNESTILIRLGKKDNTKYESNMQYASKLKAAIISKYNTIKVNIIGDSKNNYNQDLGHIAMRFDISENISYENTKTLMSYLLETLNQLE
jgi:hypothetical protein